MKVMIIPGNGNSDISGEWFPYIKKELEKFGFEVIAKNMPDPDLARKEYWLPFIEENLEGEDDSILIGHSSGAVAILRYLENHKLKGAIIVGGYYSHLGDDKEKASGYFDSDWQWNRIKENAEWIVIYASRDDPYIPIEQPRFIRDNTNAEYHEFKDEGHMGADRKKKEFPEIITLIKKKIQNYI